MAIVFGAGLALGSAGAWIAGYAAIGVDVSPAMLV